MTKKVFKNTTATKLHQELINSEVSVLLIEQIDNGTQVTTANDADMLLVQQVADAHDPTPLPHPLSDIEKLRLEQAQANAEMFEMLITMTGGGY